MENTLYIAMGVATQLDSLRKPSIHGPLPEIGWEDDSTRVFLRVFHGLSLG